MATKKPSHTIVRVEKYRGNVVFRHGSMRAMYALPWFVVFDYETLVHRPGLIGDSYGLKLSEKEREKVRVERKLMASPFPTSTVITIEVHPKTFRARLTPRYDKLIFAKPS